MRVYCLSTLILFLIGSTVYCGPPITAETAALLQSVKTGPLGERLNAFSLKFLGKPYEESPLGEGEKAEYSQNPLVRFDRFDCTTFIETVMALALSHEPKEFNHVLEKIRYRSGKVSFVMRNHFPDLDWIPNNTANGTLRDITKEVAADRRTEEAVTMIDKRKWFENLPVEEIQIKNLSPGELNQKLKKLHNEGRRFGKKEIHLKYIPLEVILKKASLSEEEQKGRLLEEQELANKIRAAYPSLAEAELSGKIHDALVELRTGYIEKETQADEAFLRRIPHGTILNIVRPNGETRGTHLLISHQGFVFQKKDAAYFRHVSRTGGGRVKDVRLSNYLKLCLLLPSIHGVNLLQVAGFPR